MTLDSTVMGPLRAVRRRLRWQAALHGAGRAAVLAVAAAAVSIYLWRLGVLGARGLAGLLVGSGALILVGALAQALRRIPLVQAARRIDASHALHDRLVSALAFAAEPAPTPFMQAALADAARVAVTVEPRRAAPLRRPRGFDLAGALLPIVAGLAILQFPHAGPTVAPPPPRLPRLSVDRDVLEPERAAAAELVHEAAESDDPELQALAKQLEQLLAQLDAGDLTRKQVFDQLAELEKRLQPQADANLDELRQRLRKAGAELGKEKLTREAGRALEKEDLQKARQELEKLAAEAERLDAEHKPEPKTGEPKLDERQRQDLARALDRAANDPQQKSEAEKKQEQEEKRLKEEQRRLQKQLAERPKDQELQRKLERNQRQLERLEREKQQRAEQQRQLQRLQRELQKAAEQLRQKLSLEAAEALRKAAQQLGQMQNEIKKLGAGQRAQVQIGELKEVLRRAGTSGQGNNGQGQSGQQEQAQNGENGKNGKNSQNGKNGQNGKDGKNGKGGQTLLEEFNSRAGAKPNALLLGGSGGDQQLLLPLGGGPPPGPQPGPGGQGSQLPGDGIGDQHDPNLMGDATRIAARHKDSRVEGKEGAGPSRSETILGSAEKGFSSRAYHRVYGDYRAVVEEVMSKERVPPGYRYYIKRYFQLIKPRE